MADKKLGGLDAYLASKKVALPEKEARLVIEVDEVQDNHSGKLALRIRLIFAGSVVGMMVVSYEQFERKDCWQAVIACFFSDSLSNEKRVEFAEEKGCEWLPEQVKKVKDSE